MQHQQLRTCKMTTRRTPSPRLIALIEWDTALWVVLVVDLRCIDLHAVARHIQMGAIERPAVEHECRLCG